MSESEWDIDNIENWPKMIDINPGYRRVISPKGNFMECITRKEYFNLDTGEILSKDEFEALPDNIPPFP